MCANYNLFRPGIASNLQYLSDLGVDVLWLSPVQNTNTFGLDVMDFDQPKSEFGDEQDFKELINATRSMGMSTSGFLFSSLSCFQTSADFVFNFFSLHNSDYCVERDEGCHGYYSEPFRQRT